MAIWRSGGQVEQADWASPTKAGAPAPAAPKKAPASPTPSSTRSQTPVNPLLQDLRSDLDSRPQTPTVVGLDKDEREEFLKRENELSDLLGERESALKAAEKLVSELKEELTFLKEQEASLSSENKSMSSQLNELRLQVERLNYDNKESIITIDILKEQNQDAKAELEEFKKTIADLKAAQKDASAEDKEKRKQEKMALMMAKFDAVRRPRLRRTPGTDAQLHIARDILREGRPAAPDSREARGHRLRRGRVHAVTRRYCLPSPPHC